MRNRNAFLTDNLPQLQNLIKRDPVSYKDEFLQQMNHFESMYTIFQLKPSEENEKFCNIVTFLSHVSHYYKDVEQTKSFSPKIVELLNLHDSILNPEVRKSLVQALIMLKGKSQIDGIELLSLFFKLFRCKDQTLRELIYKFIVQDIKAQNHKHKNVKLNKTLQSFMYKMLSDTSEIAAKKSLDVMIDLYNRKIWDDAKTVNVIAEACLSKVAKVSVTALKFFLGENEEEEEEEEDDDEVIRQLNHSSRVGGKSKAKKNKLEKTLATIRKKKNKASKAESFNFSAMHLLNDPQGFAEKLFDKLRQSNDKFFVRLMMMNVVSRVIGIHRLLVMPFYSFTIKYLNPHQQHVTLILTFLAQACHDLVPPDVIESCVMAIANNFVSDHCSGPVITVGLNSIREICKRAPLAMNSELLSDLVQYKTFKDKGVVTAARSLIQLFRDINPGLLHRKEKGKIASMNKTEALKFGQVNVVDRIPGAELLNKEEEWEEVSDEESEESESGSWIDMPSDEEVEYDEDDEESEEELEDSEVEEEMETSDNVHDSSTPIEQTKILGPSDFAKIEKLNELKEATGKRTYEELVQIGDIEKNIKKAKQTYEERMNSIQKGREGREKFGSRKGKKELSGASSTNKEKAKKKNFIMIAHKRSVTAKKKLSLRDRQKVFREHIRKQKERI